MCKAASFILTKDGVFWSKTSNRHQGIIDENNLHEDGVRGPNILRVEIVPPDSDYGLPVDKWKYSVDQDILPEWANAEHDEKRSWAALSEWLKHHCCSQGAGSSGEILVGGFKVSQQSDDDSMQNAGSDSVQKAGSCSAQKAGSYSVQNAGDDSMQKAGTGSVQITRWFVDAAWHIATRVIDETSADVWYYVKFGVWRKCTPDEIKKAEANVAEATGELL